MTSPVTTPDYTSAPVQAPLSIISVVAFVLSLFGGSLISIILGAVGLSQVKKTGARGRGFAIAAIVIGSLSLISFIAIFAIAIASSAATASLESY